MCARKVVNEEIKIYTGYIYKITNLINNKIYIGQTRRTVNKRFRLHINCAFRESSNCFLTHLSKAIRQHGSENFIVETIKEITATNVGKLCKILDKEEIFYIAKYNSIDHEIGYNNLKGGLVNNSSEELLNKKNKLSLLHIGCCVPGCVGEHLANGYCQKHYNQLYKYGHIFKRTLMDKNEIIKYDKHAEIILYNKKCQEIARTKIDLEDIEKVKHIKWGYYKCTRGESVRSNKPKLELHNFLLNHTDKSMVVMHRNGNNLDNRKENLFIVSQKEKLQNNKIPSNNTSGYKGVWFAKNRNKWQAQITIDNKTKSLGRFNTLEEAIAARQAAEKIYYNKW